MATGKSRALRRDGGLSRDRIVAAAVAVLDAEGEVALTYRALSEALATGPGAIYWHIPSKSELLTAASDAVIAKTIALCAVEGSPTEAIRDLALGMFDTIDAHPWVGAALTRAPGQLPLVRIFEHLGRSVQALGVPPGQQWASVSALLTYILGAAGQNAANAQVARAGALVRSDFLEALAAQWRALDSAHFPFTRSVADNLHHHDDRQDFLAGIDFLLKGIVSAVAA